MLLQQGYRFVPIVSHEKIIEARKIEYYLALNKTQATWKTLDENISSWIIFFLNVIQTQAKEALENLKFPARTIESIIKKLLDMKRIQKMGSGRATRYVVINK